VVESTKSAFREADARAFDVLASGHAHLVKRAHRGALVYDGIEIQGVSARLVLSYAGSAESAHCIGACASKLFDLECAKQRPDEKGLPIAVVVCGIIRTESHDGSKVVRAGERVQVSIRTQPPVDAEHIAHVISEAGGGRTGAAAAQIAVPARYDKFSDAFYVERLLELLEVKLTWPEQFSWNLDARG
jgi:hypothetical protein